MIAVLITVTLVWWFILGIGYLMILFTPMNNPQAQPPASRGSLNPIIKTLLEAERNGANLAEIERLRLSLEE